MRLTVAQRMTINTVVRPNGCHEWTGAKNNKGYGQVHYDGETVLVHRLTWELAHGPIPPGVEIKHSCDNPPCRNLNHLLPDNHQGNIDDMVNRGRHASTNRPMWAHNIRLAKCDKSSLTTDDIIAIRKSGASHRTLAYLFGVSKTLIGAIKRREQWKHIP